MPRHLPSALWFASPRLSVGVQGKELGEAYRLRFASKILPGPLCWGSSAEQDVDVVLVVPRYGELVPAAAPGSSQHWQSPDLVTTVPSRTERGQATGSQPRRASRA